ncbi:MAG TPA: NAD(P)H-dependent oxidoreductase [Bacteroidia bacterium]|nr:NAD(P)H-dependent oxidoreductase [Bacteroidia bacterium]
MELLQHLNWRYAAKRMNGKKVDEQKIQTILEATRLAASSMGLQPYSILVIKDEALLKKIHEKACKQPQIIECSHLLVFAAWSDLTEKHFDEYIHDIVQQRGVPAESLAAFKTNYMNGMMTRSAEQKLNWAARQTYIALGFALVAAAAEGVDSTPMEGFNAPALDELLKLKEKGLQSISLLPLGYRDETNDYLVKAKKVRRAKDKLFIEITDESLN